MPKLVKIPQPTEHDRLELMIKIAKQGRKTTRPASTRKRGAEMELMCQV